MKRSNDTDGKDRKKIVWDEGNLEENERIKAQLSKVKIMEPKTPYLGPQPDDEELLDEEMAPLALGDSLHTSSCGSGVGYDVDMASAETHDAPQSPEDDCFSSDSEHRSLSGNCDSDSSESKRKFEAMRKAHYNMRAALERAKHLNEGEDEDVVVHNGEGPEHDHLSNGTGGHDGDVDDSDTEEGHACKVRKPPHSSRK